MPSYSAAIDIAVPPPVVYARIADIASHGDWSVDPIQIEQVDTNRFRSSVRAKGKTITAEITVVERSEPERLVFDVVDATGRWRHTFTIDGFKGRTRLKRTIAGDLSLGQLLLYWAVLLPIKLPNAMKSLRKLKEQLERS